MRVLASLLLAVAFVPLAHAQGVADTRAMKRAAGPVWAVDYDRLYQVDPARLEATLVGELGSSGPQAMADLSGLTTALDGSLYVASDTLKALVRINPGTGAGSVVGRFGIAQPNSADPLDFAMTAACDGNLWLSSPVARQLWRVNPDNGQASLVGNLGHSITGLVVYEGRLYGMGGRGEEGWYGINTQTGQASFIGPFGPAVDYLTSGSPAVTADGSVLAMLNYVPPPAGELPPDWSDLAQLNPSTGELTILGPVTGPDGLRGIGIRGFTAGPPSCSQIIAPRADPSVPSLGWWGRLLLVLALAASTALVLRRQPAAPRA